ncbi:MAG: PDZ domain-containing protein [Planctomycetes bacterium]|nr:PDZ domain-containing protein [Planctomycetota bacterium]
MKTIRFSLPAVLCAAAALLFAPALRAEGDEEIPRSGKTHEVKFKMTGGPMVPVKQMHVQASVNDNDPVWMLFDTGASHPLVLSEAYAGTIGVSGTFSIQVAGVGQNTSTLTNVKSLQVGDYTARKLPAAIMDMSGIMSQVSVAGISFDGIVGIAFFRPFKSLEMDYRKQVVRFTEWGPNDKPDLGEWQVRRVAFYNAIENMSSGEAGFLGINADATPKEWIDQHKVKGAVTVSDVMEGGPSDGHLQSGDIITHVGPVDVRGGLEGLVIAVASHKAGDQVKITLYRDGKKRTVKVTLGKRPAPDAAATPDEEKATEPDGKKAAPDENVPAAERPGRRPSGGRSPRRGAKPAEEPAKKPAAPEKPAKKPAPKPGEEDM